MLPFAPRKLDTPAAFAEQKATMRQKFIGCH